eukprot:2898483-Amphidinium_carterae.1
MGASKFNPVLGFGSACEDCLRQLEVKISLQLDDEPLEQQEKSGRMSTVTRAEELGAELLNIAKVYCIRGSTHVGIYAWMNRALFSDLTKVVARGMGASLGCSRRWLQSGSPH